MLNDVNIQLTFLIPFYNGGKYIKDCIESICEQDIDRDNYEVIVINDASTDNSIDAVYKLQNRYDNIKIINHSENRRQGGARNTGIQNAQGTYIWFIDQDDFLKKLPIKEMLLYLVENKLDFLQFNFDEVDSTGKHIRTISYGEFSCPIAGPQYLEIRGLKLTPYTVWSRIFSRDFILNGKFKFPEDQIIFEDYGFAIETLIAAKRIMVINVSAYCYRQNELSIMHKSKNSYNALYTYYTCISCGLQLIHIAHKTYCDNPVLSKHLKEGGIWRINQFRKPFLHFQNIERNDFLSKIEKTYFSIRPYLNYINKILLNPSHYKTIIYLFTVFTPILNFLKRVKYLSQ